MKILFLSRLYYPHTGGVEKHVENVCLRLARMGFDVSMITTKFNRNLDTSEEHNGVKIRRFHQPRTKFFGLIYTWIWLFCNINLIKNADIIHIQDVFVWYLPFRYVLPKKNFYITFHGWEGKYPIPVMNVIQKRLASAFSKGSISVGNFISHHYGIKLGVITYGAISDGVLKISKNKERIIYVGRLDEDTSVKEILDFIKTEDIHNVEFCGDGEMREECEKYGKVHGFVDPQPYYEKAKYCFASGYLTIMEAMANKCLVFVVYNNSLKKNYYEMTPFAKYIVIGKNSEDLARKFKYYENNPKATQKKIYKGYNWVKKQTWDKMVDDYLKLWGINEKNIKATRK